MPSVHRTVHGCVRMVKRAHSDWSCPHSGHGNERGITIPFLFCEGAETPGLLEKILQRRFTHSLLGGLFITESGTEPRVTEYLTQELHFAPDPSYSLYPITYQRADTRPRFENFEMREFYNSVFVCRFSSNPVNFMHVFRN